jgi:hypothetical protein
MASRLRLCRIAGRLGPTMIGSEDGGTPSCSIPLGNAWNYEADGL